MSHVTCTKEIDQAPGQDHLHLTVSHPMFHDVCLVRTLIQNVDLVATLNRFAGIGQAQAMPRRDPIPVIWIGKGQRKDAEVDQVLPVNAGEALRDDGFDAEIAGANGGMLAA